MRRRQIANGGVRTAAEVEDPMSQTYLPPDPPMKARLDLLIEIVRYTRCHFRKAGRFPSGSLPRRPCPTWPRMSRKPSPSPLIRISHTREVDGRSPFPGTPSCVHIACSDIRGDRVDEALFEQHLYTGGIPAPDLIIRTGGEMRLSNFLLWQAAYSELYFTPVLWPDFGAKDAGEALREYKRRKRRFGRV